MHSHGLLTDESGVVSVFAILEAIFVAALLVLVVNTAHEASEKASLQNAADAAAISGAGWVARGMNLVSLDNVTQTQILALSTVILATDQTVKVLREVVRVQIRVTRIAASAPGFIGAAARVYLWILYSQQKALAISRKALRGSGAVRAATPPSGFLWRIMRGLSMTSAAVAEVFPEVALARAFQVARDNGADAGFLIPALSENHSLLPLMPVQAADFSYHCIPTKAGHTPEGGGGYVPLLGYEPGRGPLLRYGSVPREYFYSFVNLGGPWVYDAAEKLMFQRVCPSLVPVASDEVVVEKAAETWNACPLSGGESEWTEEHLMTIEFDSPQKRRMCAGTIARSEIAASSTAGSLAASTGRGEESTANVVTATRTPCRWSPGAACRIDRPFRDENGVEHTTVCWRFVDELTRTVKVPARPGDPRADKDGMVRVTKYRYAITEYCFVRGRYQEVRRLDGPPGRLPARKDLPVPYRLGSDTARKETHEEIKEKLEYLLVVHRNRPTRVWARWFHSALGPHRLAYAQVRVYNRTFFDLFTQDWRARLVPASMVEDGRLFAIARESSGFARFDGMGEPGEGETGKGLISGFLALERGVLSQVNNH